MERPDIGGEETPVTDRAGFWWKVLTLEAKRRLSLTGLAFEYGKALREVSVCLMSPAYYSEGWPLLAWDLMLVELYAFRISCSFAWEAGCQLANRLFNASVPGSVDELATGRAYVRYSRHSA